MNHSNTITQNQLAKRGRGRPRKIDQGQHVVPLTSAESSAQSSDDLPNILAITHLSNDIDHALDFLYRNKRPTVTLAYKQPLIHWKQFCDANRQKFNTDQEHPYTVGLPEWVVAFFTECVVKRKFNKNVPIGTDVRTQIYVRDTNNDSEDLTTTLPQLTDAARLSKDGRSKVLEVPLSYEAVVTNADRAAHCVIRDLCKPGDLIQMMKKLWLLSSKNSLQEMFSIAAHHHMLLRDQDIRNLNFSDCFCMVIPKQQHHL
ncbi:hypothetical protein INT45_010831 [Circinella minor]|uniref:Uncharacterized protein n=1 Tax=Circinella minor TaxID=1195481 RepID=A0A8H7S8S7_9FUNG|nr:hypothetical protein INT45_010831 [Circinella minor]